MALERAKRGKKNLFLALNYTRELTRLATQAKIIHQLYITDSSPFWTSAWYALKLLFIYY